VLLNRAAVPPIAAGGALHLPQQTMPSGTGDTGERLAWIARLGDVMAEISRILTALGLVAASVGLTVYGIGAAFVEPGESQTSIGLIMMIVGVIATAIGVVMSRQIPEEE
jgi:hypothetical protein